MSSNAQSFGVVRVRGPRGRRIPICATCLGVLDVVATPWAQGPLPEDVDEACVSCGGVAEAWVEPRPDNRPVAIEVDETGRSVVLTVTGAIDRSGMEIVAAEIAANGQSARPVIVDLAGATLQDGVDLEAVIGGMAGQGLSRIGVVVDPHDEHVVGAVGASVDVVVGVDAAEVLDALAPRRVTK